MTEEQPAKPETKSVNLIAILTSLEQSPEVLELIAENIQQKNKERFASVDDVKNYLALSIAGDKDNKPKPLEVAKLIESSVGSTTMRIISALDADAKSKKKVEKMLIARLWENSFEGRAERGMYIGVLESYDVKWPYEKAARDIWQNFNDANHYTLDDVEMSVDVKDDQATVKILGQQNYDWRKLAHFGGTDKADDERAAGGFGEGTKILSLILLRDYGVKKIKFASRDWEVEFYLEEVPEESYDEKKRGLYLKKKRHKEQTGNTLEITLDKELLAEQISDLEKAKQFFHSSENPDFKNPSFDNPDTGGFKVLPREEEDGWKGKYFKSIQRGHLYMAGQRVNYDDRNKWETVDGVNIWTHQKILAIGRDRGLITHEEMFKDVIPFVIDSMTEEEQIKAVYEFKQYWEDASKEEVGGKILLTILKALVDKKVKMEFEPEYLANDFKENPGAHLSWLENEIGKKGFFRCMPIFQRLGMRTISQEFFELQKKIRLEASKIEEKKIELLYRAVNSAFTSYAGKNDIWLIEDIKDPRAFVEEWDGSRSYYYKREHGGAMPHPYQMVPYNGSFHWIQKSDLHHTQDGFGQALHLYLEQLTK